MGKRQHERKEKICLNCGSEVYGRYCHVCGQENVEPNESFGHLVRHFFEDITHFDGKFFTTLKYLLFKPGFLSKEYIAGKRVRYLHPIRMYVFTSFIFFFVIWGFYSSRPEHNTHRKNEQTVSTPLEKLKNAEKGIKDDLKDSDISPEEKLTLKNKLTLIEATIDTLNKNPNAPIHYKFDRDNESILNLGFFNVNTGDTITEKQYDSVQQSLPANKKDNFFERIVQKREIQLREEYNYDKELFGEHKWEQFKHHFPQMLFLSLPIFALLLELLYIRNRKKYFYTHHIIYSIHLYCALFIFILLGLWINSIFKNIFNVKTGWIIFIFILGSLYYWYKSIRNFYEQSRGKTIFKMIILSVTSFIINIILLLLLALFSIVSI